MRPISLAAVLLASAALLTACDHASADTAKSTHHLPSVVGGVPAQGTIKGAFRIVGGPVAPGGSTPNRPLSGTIVVHHDTRNGPVLTTVTVPKNGRFTVNLVAGRYFLVGRTPQISGAGQGCPAFHPVTVSDGATTDTRVLCEVP